MATPKKVQVVTELTEKVNKAKSIVFAEHQGITHKELETLRKNLRKVNAEMVISKNRLIKRALGESGESVSEALVKDTAAVFSYGDEIAGVKELATFLKAAGKGKAKGGLLGKTVLSAKDVVSLAALPGKQELLGKLAGQLMAPIQGLHYSLSWNLNRLVWALNSIKEKKG